MHSHFLLLRTLIFTTLITKRTMFSSIIIMILPGNQLASGSNKDQGSQVQVWRVTPSDLVRHLPCDEMYSKAERYRNKFYSKSPLRYKEITCQVINFGYASTVYARLVANMMLFFLDQHATLLEIQAN